MRLTTITAPNNREWEIQVRTDYYTQLFIDFVSPFTDEVITGLYYNLIDDTYKEIPPFNIFTTEVFKDNKKLYPMVAFVDRLVDLISVSNIIRDAIGNTDAKAGWELDKPHSIEEYIDIVTKDVDSFKDVINLGIDTIKTAIENSEFHHEYLSRVQFQELCGFLSVPKI